LENRPGVENSLQSRKIARTWLARLEDVERTLAEDNMEHLAEQLESPNYDAVPKDVLLKNRGKLLGEIRVAKDFFRRASQPDPADRAY
jgi:hypothetical protein